MTIPCRLLDVMWLAILGAAVPFALWAQSPAPPGGRVFYIDFEAGADTNDGRSPETAFRRAPDDPAADGQARATRLQPGDTVRFKGGVVYRGSIVVRNAGAEGAPIVFDGNTDGTWGEGRAVIDGSDPVEGWRRLTSAGEARGNPHWRELWTASVPGEVGVFTANLIQGETLLSIARDPSPEDPFFRDELRTMREIAAPGPQTYLPVRIDAPGLRINPSHRLDLLVDGDARSPAVIDPMEGARVTFTLEQPRTVSAFAVVGGNRPARAKEIAFIADGTEVATMTLAQEGGRHAVDLEEPVTFRELRLEFRSIYEGATHAYGTINQVEALTVDRENVLAMGDAAYSYYVDPEVFTQADPDYWKGAYFTFHGGANWVYTQRVIGFDPAEHRLRFTRLEVPVGRRFAMLNALGAITEPGEYVVCPDVDAEGNRRVVVWPPEAGPDGPAGMTVSRRADLFRIADRAHLVIQGFILQKQGGENAHAIYATGRGTTDLVILDNEIRFGNSNQRDSVVAVVHCSRVRIENNYIHHNRRSRGFRLTIDDSVVTRNRLHRNGSTGIGFFGARRSEMTYNTVTGHTGVHANALTVYADSEDILVEGNVAHGNNIPFTVQNSANVTVRNNVLVYPAGVAVGIWTGWHRNLRIEHNLLLGGHEGPAWAAGVFSNSRQIDGLHVHNNIMTGSSGTLPGNFSHNIYTHLGPNDDANALPEGTQHVADWEALFVDAANLDFRLRPGSPAIDAGVDRGVERDRLGRPRPVGIAPDIGPYAFDPGADAAP